jgi:uncharacterized protein YjiS (DUF1127 family)
MDMTIMYRPRHYLLPDEECRPALPRPPTLSARIVAFMRRWHDRRARYLAADALRRLDIRMLKDIGIDRSEINSVIYTGRYRRQPSLMNR